MHCTVEVSDFLSCSALSFPVLSMCKLAYYGLLCSLNLSSRPFTSSLIYPLSIGVKSKAQLMLEDMDDHEESSNQAGMEDKSSSLTILTASNTPAMRAARELRGKQETLDKQIEIDLASNEARAQRVADLLAKFKTESAQAIEAMADDHDLKIEVYE